MTEYERTSLMLLGAIAVKLTAQSAADNRKAVQLTEAAIDELDAVLTAELAKLASNTSPS